MLRGRNIVVWDIPAQLLALATEGYLFDSFGSVRF